MAAFPDFETIWQDTRYALRLLRKNPGFTTVAILTLALGIGVNTTIFSVVNSVLLKPLPFKDPDRLAMIWETSQKDRATTSPISSADFVDWKDQTRSFEELAGWRFLYFNLSGKDQPERVQGLTVSASFLPLLGAQLQSGRAFLPEEEQAGRERVAVLSNALWRRRFGANPNLVGQKIEIEGESYTVVGILAPSFQIFQVLNRPLDIYVPLTFDRSRMNRQDHDTFVYARLRPGATLKEAQSEMDVLYRRLAQQYPQTNLDRGALVISMSEGFTGEIRPTLLLLLSAVGLVLLIACSNVANLALARATFRQREIAVRTALGASASRLWRQLLTENLLLALLGGIAGTSLAFYGIRVLNDVIPSQAVKRWHDFVLDGRVLAFTLVVSLLSGLISGIVPALRLSRHTDLAEATARGSSRGPGTARVAGALVISEVAVAVALACCAVLLVRSFMFLQGMPRGINPHNVLTTQVWLPRAKYSSPQQVANFYREVLQRIETLPGVEAASAINFPPLAVQYTTVNLTIDGQAPSSTDRLLNARYSIIGSEYFRTLNIPLLSGRTFSERDSDEAHGVVIVSAAMARRFWPGSDPIGHQIRLQLSQQKHFWIPESQNLPLTVVGVVGDVRYDGLGGNNLPQFYLPYQQNPSSIMNLVVRTKSDPLRLTKTVREQVWAVDKDEPVFDTKTIEDVAADSFARPHMLAWLLGSFAFLALLLAGIGVYGLISYAVNQRTREIGIRVALGARSADVRRLVFQQGLSLTLAGLALGLCAAWAMSGLLGRFLFGVKPTDPLSFAGVVLLLASVAVLACYIPAQRAARVDPMVALRHE